jgi:hypothetical protein
VLPICTCLALGLAANVTTVPFEVTVESFIGFAPDAIFPVAGEAIASMAVAVGLRGRVENCDFK